MKWVSTSQRGTLQHHQAQNCGVSFPISTTAGYMSKNAFLSILNFSFQYFQLINFVLIRHRLSVIQLTKNFYWEIFVLKD